jgi:periplasmic divalent cation tolerance protein
MSEAQLVLCTCPDDASATAVARALVDEQLAACVSRLGGAISTYAWDGAVQEAPEVLLLIKTTRDRFEAMRARLLTVHPYEVPEVIALDISGGHAPYMEWLRAAVAPPGA